MLTRKGLVVSSSSFRCPLCSCVSKIILNFLASLHNIFASFKQRVLDLRLVCWGSASTSFARTKYSDLRMTLLEVIKSICGRHENTICFRSLFLSCSECSRRCIWFALYGEVKLPFGLLVHSDQARSISSRVWALLWIEPGSLEAMSVASERSKPDTLLFLLRSILFVPGWSLQFQGAVYRKIWIDVRAWSGIWGLHSLVHMSLIAAVESSMDSLLHNDSIFDIVLLFLMIILAWSRILGKSLPSIRSFTFVFPEFPSLCFR